MSTDPRMRESDLKKTYWTPRRVSRMAIFVALSAVECIILTVRQILLTED